MKKISLWVISLSIQSFLDPYRISLDCLKFLTPEFMKFENVGGNMIPNNRENTCQYFTLKICYNMKLINFYSFVKCTKPEMWIWNTKLSLLTLFFQAIVCFVGVFLFSTFIFYISTESALWSSSVSSRTSRVIGLFNR